VLKRLESANVTREFRKSTVRFLGHIVDCEGVRADPSKTEAINRMEVPSTVSDLRRLLGLVNQLGKFSSNIAELSKPLRELLSLKRAWLWGQEQERAFACIKEELVKPIILTLYDPNAEVKVSADASSFGLGAVLLQRTEGEWKPIAYASRSMTPTRENTLKLKKRRWPQLGPVKNFQITFWDGNS